MGRRGRGAGGRGNAIVLEFKTPEVVPVKGVPPRAGPSNLASKPATTATNGVPLVPTSSATLISTLLNSDDNETLLEALVERACDSVSHFYTLCSPWSLSLATKLLV